jgi:hypothetical protein
METGETVNQIKITVDGNGREARRREVAAVWTGRGECVHYFYDPIAHRRVCKYTSFLWVDSHFLVMFQKRY